MKFIILCHPRTASTLLIRALGEHPDIRQGMEIFNPVLEGRARYVDWRKRIFEELYGPRQSYVNASGYLDEDRFDLGLLAKRFFEDFDGTKIMYDHLGLDSNAWEIIRSLDDLRVIVLERNVVESAVSFQIAMKTDIWHIENGSSNPPGLAMEYPVEFFSWFYDHFCSRADDFTAMFQQYQVKRVDYSELTQAWVETIAGIQQHLGVNAIGLPKSYDRRCRQDLRDLVLNYDEIETHYADHPVLARHFERAGRSGPL